MRPSTRAALTGLVGLAVTALLTGLALRQDQVEESALLDLELAAVSDRVRDAMESAETAVRATRAYIDRLDALDPMAVRGFIAALRPHDTLRSVSWIARVPADAVEPFVARMREDAAGFTIWELDGTGAVVPARPRDVYFPQTVASVQRGIQTRLGYDLASEPRRARAIERARTTRELAATAPIRFAADPVAAPGIILFEASTPGRLDGLTTAAIDLQALAGPISATVAQRGLALRLVDATDGDSHVIHDDARFADGLPARQRRMIVGQRLWDVSLMRVDRAALVERHARSGLVLLLGLATVGALVGWVRMRQERQNVLAAQAESRAILDGIGPMTGLVETDGTVRTVNAAALESAGITADEVVGRKLWDTAWWADAAPAARRRLEQAVADAASGRDARYDAEIHIKEGIERVIDLWIRPLRDGRRVAALVVSGSDITARKQGEQMQTMLMRELDHRIKNNLAIIQALVRRTARGQASVNAYESALLGRIHAMARAHDMLASQSWRGADLERLLREELEPFSGRAVRLEGPPITVGPRAASALALMFHELATNASKYGALSVPGGRLDVTWRREDEPAGLVLEWRELNGPPAAVPERKGFGTTLIERSAAELGGTVETDYAPAGLAATLRLPFGTRVEAA